MSLGTRDARGRDLGISYLEFQDWRDSAKAFSGMAAFSGQTMNISDEGRPPERVTGPYISGNAIFATIALALSAVGLYAVTAYSVSQRTQEIGVRMALGAQAPRVWWLVLRGALVQLVIGLTLGIAGGFGVGRLLSSLLVQSNARDAVTLSSIATLLIVVSMAATFWPARKATRLDPVSALRYE